MEQPVLNDKNIFPTEEIIFSHIGKSKKLWLSVFEYIHANFPELSEEWRYYNDGKSWLLKVIRKTKTIFWLSVFKKGFMMTFYYTDKAEKVLMDSGISDELKEQFIKGKKYNKIKGVTVVFKSMKDVDYAVQLIRIKISLK